MKPIFLMVVMTLAGCMAADPDRRDRTTGDAADTSTLSCAELAELRASEQYEAESASLDEREGGLFENSSLSRDFIAFDAAARRRAVEEKCQRLRSQPAAGEIPVPTDQ